FLSVGALLYIYAQNNGIDVPKDLITGKPRTDLLFPEIAFNHLNIIPSIVFLLGLTAATFATTDSALTALTTSLCVELLGMDEEENANKPKVVRTRHLVHITCSMLMFMVIIGFDEINDASVVAMIFRVASYTYGPLLGLYTFGLFVKNRKVLDKATPIICIVAPLLTFWIVENSELLFGNYKFDVELIILNGLLTFVGLWVFSKKSGN